MTNQTLRRTGGAISLLSVLALVVIVPSMATRLKDRDSSQWAVAKVAPDAFEYFNGVQGTVASTEDGVRVTWGSDELTLPISGQVTEALPGLAKYRGWFSILALAQVEGGQTLEELQAALDTGDVEPMLVAVLRSPPPGVNADTWGAAEYKEWRYTYHFLTPEGTIERYDEPVTYTYYGEPITEQGYRSYRALERASYTWPFIAAMHVTPGLHTPAARNSSPFAYPNYAGVRSAIAEMGWTWPAAGTAVLTLIVGGLMFAGSFVKRRYTAE